MNVVSPKAIESPSDRYVMAPAEAEDASHKGDNIRSAATIVRRIESTSVSRNPVERPMSLRSGVS